MRFETFLLLALVPTAVAQEPAAKPAHQAAKIFEGRCAKCHTVPDPKIATDLAWLDQVHRTTWTSTPKQARAALIEWLRSESDKRPRRIEAVPKDRSKLGLVTTSFSSGSVVLSSPGKRDATLVWSRKASGSAKSDARGLPPGTWRVRTTRVEREKAGEHWFVSATSPEGQKLELAPGKPTHLEVSPVVHFAGKVTRKGRNLQLGFGITSEDSEGGRSGMAIYRNYKRVPVRYEVRDTDGKVLAHGRMNYGWGGGGWASVRLANARTDVEVVWSVATGPFPLEGKLTVRSRHKTRWFLVRRGVMYRIRRKTAPKVRDGQTQFKNNWKLTPHWSQTTLETLVIDRERPGRDYRHVVRKPDVRRFLRLLPDWDEIARGLDAIVLAQGEPGCLGWHRPGIVALCAWEHDIQSSWHKDFVDEHREIFDRLGVEREHESGPWYTLGFDDVSARGFQLMHILLHELGHHHDRMTTRSQARAARGESYAEEYANRYAERLWDAYFREFG